jgi:glycosyltransferase involved in cell wall biosynthesis
MAIMASHMALARELKPVDLLVSVVTPFRNTEEYLEECISSVLRQTHVNFEYILSDNCSSDRSLEIAEKYARIDSRIRLVRQETSRDQVAHYNNALSRISPDSKYCKIVQADDLLFPECLERMIRVFERSGSIGLVSSYYLEGDTVRGSGFPYAMSEVQGREMAAFYLKTGTFVFGSPSTVMYRSSLVRSCVPFYEEGLLHEDTEKCMQLLENWNFGFVPQVLSFSREEENSISGSRRSFLPRAIDWHIIVQRYAKRFLDDQEAARVRSISRQGYYRLLGKEVLRFRDSSFWMYQAQGLISVGERINWPCLVVHVCWQIIWMLLNPGKTVMKGWEMLMKGIRS